MNPDPEQVIFKLDSQILNSMDLCWERYNLEHIQNWRPAQKAAALERGSAFHRMVRYYYVEKRKGRAILGEHSKVVEEAAMVGRLYAAQSSMSMDDFDDDLRVFKEYILKWQYDGWEILDIEQPFTKVLYESPFLKILYEGVVDMRIRDPKIGEAVVDHKTESRKSYPYILSNQFQGYEWAFDLPVIVNKVGYQTSLPADEKFRRLEHRSGAFAIEEWKKDTILTVMDAVERHKTGVFPKNRTSCDKYSGCIFQRVCKVPPETRPFKLQAYFYKADPWDPYARDDDDVREDEAVKESA
jgi:hypothetical protein